MFGSQILARVRLMMDLSNSVFFFDSASFSVISLVQKLLSNAENEIFTF